MPRPRKARHVGCKPMVRHYGPMNIEDELRRTIYLSIDEYETIRLIDYLGLQQDECAEKMHVGRTTAQRIYNDAKQKIADAIVNGKMIEITGGDVVYTNEVTEHRGHGQGNRGRMKRGVE